MHIIAQTENKICVELTHDDMVELDITYEDLDYSNIETRRVLWELLDEARHELGHEISLTQKMLIEALPDSNGGCLIFFTVSDEPSGRSGRKQLVKIGEKKVVCQSDGIDEMIELSRHLLKTVKLKKSELFTDGGRYRLIFQPEMPGGLNPEMIAGEFCEVLHHGASAAYTAEHWKLLASPDAAEMLTGL